jgi:pyridoxamine 5'-phosphate oxidase
VTDPGKVAPPAVGRATHPHHWAVSWLPDNADPARPLMTLATVDGTGAPAARTVLLSEVTDDGFVFHTDSRSRKVQDLAADPRVCLTLVFPAVFRQLVVQGAADPQDPTVSRAAYGRRSAYLRHLAWLNGPELARLSDDERRDRWTRAVAETPDGPVDPPPHWTGYRVTPTRYTFWEGGLDLPSRRTEYRRSEQGWTVDYLPG